MNPIPDTTTIDEANEQVLSALGEQPSERASIHEIAQALVAEAHEEGYPLVWAKSDTEEEERELVLYARGPGVERLLDLVWDNLENLVPDSLSEYEIVNSADPDNAEALAYAAEELA